MAVPWDLTTDKYAYKSKVQDNFNYLDSITSDNTSKITALSTSVADAITKTEIPGYRHGAFANYANQDDTVILKKGEIDIDGTAYTLPNNIKVDVSSFLTANTSTLYYIYIDKSAITNNSITASEVYLTTGAAEWNPSKEGWYRRGTYSNLSNVTGVELFSAFGAGSFDLVWDNGNATLSWGGGTAVTITSDTDVLLQDGSGNSIWANVDFSALPGVNATDSITVSFDSTTSDRLVGFGATDSTGSLYGFSYDGKEYRYRCSFNTGNLGLTANRDVTLPYVPKGASDSYIGYEIYNSGTTLALTSYVDPYVATTTSRIIHRMSLGGITSGNYSQIPVYVQVDSQGDFNSAVTNSSQAKAHRFLTNGFLFDLNESWRA
jgi:hypothetical protein